MSGQHLAVSSEQAYALWAKREGWSQGRLAEECLTSRAHLNQVLTGKRSGGPTWRRIVKVLPMEGLLLLQHCAAWNNFAGAALQKRIAAEEDEAGLVKIASQCRAEPTEVAS